MTLPEEALQAGIEALEAADGCTCHGELSTADIAEIVGEAVLKWAAGRQRRLPIDDAFLAGQRDALADLIDPDKQESA